MTYLSNYMPEEIFSHLIHGKVMEEEIEKKDQPQFRDGSTMNIKQSPCPCMNNKHSS
jgi:hypothetical protein